MNDLRTEDCDLTEAAAPRFAAVFSVLALALMALGIAVSIASSGAGAQDPIETFTDPATFKAILEGADSALRMALFFGASHTIAYAGAVGFAAIGFRHYRPPVAWAGGLGMIAAMGLDVVENLLMLGSLGLVYGERTIS